MNKNFVIHKKIYKKKDDHIRLMYIKTGKNEHYFNLQFKFSYSFSTMIGWNGAIMDDEENYYAIRSPPPRTEKKTVTNL